VSRPVRAPVGLDRGTLSGRGLFLFSVSASAPMTTLVGGIVAAFAGTGVIGVPSAFALLTCALSLFSTGYVSMARYLPHAGPLYAHIARGLGPVRGVGAAAVAVLSYAAIHCCLYGLLGATTAQMLGGAWWSWALAAWAVVALLGVLHVSVNATVLAALLVAEIAVVLAFDAAALTHPAGGHLDVRPLWPPSLFGDGVGGVLALSVACFVGYECTLAFAEEARSHQAVARASFGSLAFLGALYTLSAWAVTAATGLDKVSTVTTDLIFTVFGARFGVLAVMAASLLLLTSMTAAMISFHQTVARYVYVLTRERLLPARFGRIRRGSGVPVGGSLVHSGLSLSVIGVWVLLRLDPMVLFLQFAALAAVGIMTLMAVCCLATLGFYRKGGGGNENAWTRIGAPLLGAAAIGVVVVVTVTNLNSLTGAKPGTAGVWLLPAIVAAVGVAGLAWGALVRLRHRTIADRLGRGETEPLAELEHHLASVDI
jgi:amino acid transporter